MLSFVLGVLVGAVLVVLLAVWWIVDPWGEPSTPQPFVDQFRPLVIPKELRAFLKTGEDGQGVSRWESCLSMTLFFTMFFQEHKDTRQLRRWFHKRIQLELNDIVTRSAAGRLISDIRIRDLSLGTQFPVIRGIRVEKCEMADDKESFESVVFLVDMDYTGGFEVSIDVHAVFGRNASFSLKVTRLAGKVRLVMSRKPFSHWTFAFVTMPTMDFDVGSQIQGHQLKTLIPLITNALKRALQRKHVWPNYKIRYRPVFPNPLLQPTPPHSAFAHVKVDGGMEVTVLQCTRLKIDMVDGSAGRQWDVYCTVSIEQRPLGLAASRTAHLLSVSCTYSRYELASPCGLTFDKEAALVNGARVPRVHSIHEGGLADKAGLKPGDAFVAINNVPIRSERQVVRLLGGTLGDLMVLVERNMDESETEEEQAGGDGIEEDELIGEGGDPDDAFVVLGEKRRGKKGEEGAADSTSLHRAHSDATTNSDSHRRHSASLSVSARTSLSDVLGALREEGDKRAAVPAVVQRTESARVPQVLVSMPSIDLRRTRSESQLDTSSVLPSSLDAVLDSMSIASADDRLEAEIEAVEKRLGVCERMASSSREETPETACGGSVGEGMDERGREEEPDRDKDATLTPGQKLVPAGSCASLASSVSMNASVHSSVSGVTGGGGEGDEETSSVGGLSRNRPQSARRKIHGAFAAGKRRVFELAAGKRKGVGGVGEAEVATDAGEVEGGVIQEADEHRDGVSPTGEGGDGRMEEKRRRRHLLRRGKGRHSASPGVRVRCAAGGDESPSLSTGAGGASRTRSTRTVHFNQDVLWGQSLHFDLEGADAGRLKYMNITVHARERASDTASSPLPVVCGASSLSATPPNARPSVPPTHTQHKTVMLGYTSLYIPQIIDDCRLTISNCHREVYHLKPPEGVVPKVDPHDEFARHAGYDPRLCYGDVTLGFRFFSQGLPKGAGLNPSDDSGAVGGEDVECAEEEAAVVHHVAAHAAAPLCSDSTGVAGVQPHRWETVSTRGTCAMCRGKVWMKSASQCSICRVFCHQKCEQKAATGIACLPHGACVEDVLSGGSMHASVSSTATGGSHGSGVSAPPTSPQHAPTLNSQGVRMERPDELPTTSVIPAMSADKSQPWRAGAGGETHETQLSRRTRIKNKVTEKFSVWRRGGTTPATSKKDERDGDADSVGTRTTDSPQSPVTNIHMYLSDIVPHLEGSPFINQVFFQPGDSFNEETIRNAKRLGVHIFEQLSGHERQASVNEQIDKVQRAIRETKAARLAAMQTDREEFERLEERLQALAVVMLHYCAALQDCCEKDDETVSTGSLHSRSESRASLAPAGETTPAGETPTEEQREDSGGSGESGQAWREASVPSSRPGSVSPDTLRPLLASPTPSAKLLHILDNDTPSPTLEQFIDDALDNSLFDVNN